jgi:hypothetical protein
MTDTLYATERTNHKKHLYAAGLLAVQIFLVKYFHVIIFSLIAYLFPIVTANE